MRKIILSLSLAFLLGGCAINEQEACKICASKSPCQAPPELNLVPQGELTLPPPNVKIVRPEGGGKPYYVIDENSFYTWLDNNRQLESYIRECRRRNEYIKKYYEDGLAAIRNRGEEEKPDGS